MFSFFKKKLPIGGEEKVELDAVQLWQVEWRSRHGGYIGNTVQEFEVFTSERDAQRFKVALEDAFKLIRHTYGDKVVLTKRK